LTESTDKRPDREPEQTDQEEQLVAELVAKLATDQQKGTESQRERIDNPRKLAFGEVKLSLDGRQRDVDSREVGNVQELGQTKDNQNGPLRSLSRCFHGGEDRLRYEGWGG